MRSGASLRRRGLNDERRETWKREFEAEGFGALLSLLQNRAPLRLGRGL